MASHTYQEAVQWVRNQPDLQQIVKDCYLDEDTVAAAQRFAKSEEFFEITKVLGLSSISAPKKVLDVGCGNGIVSYAFASLGHDVTALDPDDSDDVGLKAIGKLMPTLKKGAITTSQAFAEALPFPDAQYDVVYTRQALHHFEDLGKGLQECARVLKPGGKLLATREHVVDNDEQMQIFLRDHLLHKLHGGENAYPLETYLTALRQAPLKVVNCFAPFDSVINHFPAANAEIITGAKQRISDRFGAPVASLIGNLPLAVSYHRGRLSSTCDIPGRLYSFLCQKEN